MNINIISKDKCLIYQTYEDMETELIGEPALLVEEYKTGGTVSISTHENNSVQINYDTLPALIKLFQGILKDKDFHDIKF